MTSMKRERRFYGWRVAYAAFVLGFFGWGLGFYGPPIFLNVLYETRGWPILLISTAVTFHFLVGAVTGANLPKLHDRFGSLPSARSGFHSLHPLSSSRCLSRYGPWLTSCFRERLQG